MKHAGWLIRRARFLKRSVRAMRGKDLIPRREVACDRIRLGTDGAQWCIWSGGLARDAIVYSVGIGDDISFDLELIHRFGVTVHAFDPTPQTREWLLGQSLPPEFVFHAFGLAHFDGVASFAPPKNPAHISYSMVEGKPSGAIDMPVRRLRRITEELGHAHIDLLKMDVEGAEYGILADLLVSGPDVRQLLVEFHHRWPEIGVARTRETIANLHQGGFRIFDVAPSGEEYSFLNTRAAVTWGASSGGVVPAGT